MDRRKLGAIGEKILLWVFFLLTGGFCFVGGIYLMTIADGWLKLLGLPIIGIGAGMALMFQDMLRY